MKRWIRIFAVWCLMFFCFPSHAEEVLDELSFDEIEKELDEIFEDGEEISFREMVLDLMRGEQAFDLQEIGRRIADICFGELNSQKQVIIQILLLTIVAAVFANYTNVFEKSQTADISFYLIYLILVMNPIKSISGNGIHGDGSGKASDVVFESTSADTICWQLHLQTAP